MIYEMNALIQEKHRALRGNGSIRRICKRGEEYADESAGFVICACFIQQEGTHEKSIESKAAAQ